MEVVVVLADKTLQISQKIENVNTLLQGLVGQVRWHDVNVELLFGKDTHMLIGLPIMR